MATKFWNFFRSSNSSIRKKRKLKTLRTFSDSEINDGAKSNPKIDKKQSLEKKISLPLPIISVTKARNDSFSSSSSSKFGIVEDDVFISSESESPKSSTKVLPPKSYNNDLSPIETHSIKRLSILQVGKCRICNEAIYFRGYQCKVCLLAGHRRCFQFLMIKCNYKPLSEKEKVFGVELFEVGQIPEVLVSCIREAERRGYKNIKGIYRIGGNKHNVTRIRSSFENGPYLVDLRKVPCYDIGEIVKLYLSELPTPLILPDIQDDILRVAKEWPHRKVPYTKEGTVIIIFELRDILNHLPPVYFITLSYLIHHLKRIAGHHREIEIHPCILAITFAPLLFKTLEPGINRRIMLNAIPKGRAVELLIAHATEIFGPQPKIEQKIETVETQ